MSETALLADHIDRTADAIIEVWKGTVERYGSVPDAGRLSDREFADHIPELLTRLADRLRGGDADAAPTGQKHGKHRWSQGYAIVELVTELGLLRSTLIRDSLEFARGHEVDDGELERIIGIINEVVDEAAAQSVAQFEEDGRHLGNVLLSDFEQRNATVEAERIQLQALINSMPVGVWVCNAEGAIVGVNREAERVQGFSEADSLGRLNVRDADLFHRHYRLDGREFPISDRPLARALDGSVVVLEESIWPTPTGDLTVATSAAPLVDGDGRITGAVAVVQDVSDRKRLEAELALSEARFRGIVEHSPVMIWQVDADGRCDFFNQTWLDFRGLDRHEAGPDGWAEGIHPEDVARCRATFARSFADRRPFEMVYRLRHTDGQFRSVTDRGTPYHDARGRFLGFLGSCLDITERVELERQLEQQSQHKSRLMAALSHDARTPLNAVVLSAKLLESQVPDQDDPEIQESLRTIRNAVRNVMDLLGDLLDLTRIDAGATRAEASRFPLQATLAECISGIEPQARAKGLDVRLAMGDLADDRVETDRAKLKQILSNLLSNALRYTEVGSIEVSARRLDGRILIAVADTGVGIAPRDQERIFDEFAVLEHPNRPRGEGTGLGLAICRRLAHLLQGEILLTSTRGRGSRFTIALPDAILAPRDAAVEVPAAAPARSFAGPILIAEDHAESRKALGKVLRGMGYQTVEAGDGREVLAAVARERPMLVLMDVNMPGMDGVEATLALRADPATRDLPIFALTGDVSLVNRQRIGEVGISGYLEKPVTWEKLEAALAQSRDQPRAGET